MGESRRRFHERALQDAHRHDQTPTTGPADTQRWRARRADRRRAYLLSCAGLAGEDLEADTARWVDRLASLGDDSDVAGAAAFAEAALAAGNGAETPPAAVGSRWLPGKLDGLPLTIEEVEDQLDHLRLLLNAAAGNLLAVDIEAERAFLVEPTRAMKIELREAIELANWMDEAVELLRLRYEPTLAGSG
jgi:hypothetical protein